MILDYVGMAFETPEMQATPKQPTNDDSQQQRDGILKSLPSRIGPYVIDRFLGTGMRSEVYEAHDDGGSRIALKVVSAGDTPIKERLYREFRARDAISDFSHVAKAYQPHEYVVDGTAIIGYPIELFGGNLRFLIARLMKLAPEKRVKEIAETWIPQITAGLKTCHSAGVLHLDLKPGNILYSPESSRLALSDFGVSSVEIERVYAGASKSTGTPVYMAPEQTLRESPDERTDIYALGVILAEMLTGSPSAGGLNEFSEAVVSVVDTCMRRDRSRRFASVEEFEEALQEALGNKKGKEKKDRKTKAKTVKTEKPADTEREYPVLEGSARGRTRTVLAVQDDSLAIKQITKDGEKTVKTLSPLGGSRGVRMSVNKALRWGGVLMIAFFGIPVIYLVVGAVVLIFSEGLLGESLGIANSEIIALGGSSLAMYGIPVILYLMHIRLPKIGRIKGGWKRLSYSKVTLATNDGTKVSLPMRRGDAEELQWRIG